jgi:hypothetical protein
MRSAILAFVLGVWCLQQMSQLPDWYWAIPLPLILLPVWLLPRRLRPGKNFFLLIFSAGLGLFWATFVAQLRLSDALPHEWEGQDVQLVGVVASLPQMQERGERFLLDVEQVETDGALVPHHISITRYFAGYGDAVPHSVTGEFHPGERWRLTVRLKQPHGSYNPQGFDFEAWAMERNIRATGYIRKSPANARLQQLVYRPAYLVECVREQVRQRFQSILRDAPYAGVLRALVIGDDDAISDTDWEIFRRTGVVHLMSISGLHVTMVAGLAFALVFFFVAARGMAGVAIARTQGFRIVRAGCRRDLFPDCRLCRPHAENFLYAGGSCCRTVVGENSFLFAGALLGAACGCPDRPMGGAGAGLLALFLRRCHAWLCWEQPAGAAWLVARGGTRAMGGYARLDTLVADFVPASFHCFAAGQCLCHSAHQPGSDAIGLAGGRSPC